MRKFLRIVSLLTVLGICAYLLLPSPAFPNPPADARQSNEPADTESIYRRAYYTNYSREEIMKYYRSQFSTSPFSHLPLPIVRLNYPPEEGYSLIRDQTQTSWLEELVHPWRESLYINGFYPTKPTEQINIGGVHYVNKITIRYVPSHPVTRLTALAFALLCIITLKKEYAHI